MSKENILGEKQKLFGIKIPVRRYLINLLFMKACVFDWFSLWCYCRCAGLWQAGVSFSPSDLHIHIHSSSDLQKSRRPPAQQGKGFGQSGLLF